MNLTKTIALATCMAGAMALAANDGVLIRRTLTADSTETYKVVMNMKQTISMPNGGDQEMNVSSESNYGLKFVKVDDASGTGDIELSIKVTKIDAGAMAAGMLTPEKLTPAKPFKGKIDTRNRLSIDLPKNLDMNAMMAGTTPTPSSLAAVLIELPEKAVSIGDSWDVVIPKGPFTGKEDQKLTEKLIGEKSVDGHDVWVVSLNGKIKTDLDMTDMLKNAENNPMAGQKVLVKGSVDLSGEGLVDKKTGMTLSLSTKMKTKGSLEMPDMNMTIETGGSGETLVTLTK